MPTFLSSLLKQPYDRPEASGRWQRFLAALFVATTLLLVVFVGLFSVPNVVEAVAAGHSGEALADEGMPAKHDTVGSTCPGAIALGSLDRDVSATHSEAAVCHA